MNIKALVGRNDESAVLAECESGEESAVKTYQEALNKALPEDVKSIIVRQFDAVQDGVEELALSGIRRLRFVTGPGKTSIENHFDINGELIAFLRETGKEELLQELDFERQELLYFYTRQRRQLGLGHAVLCAKPIVGEQAFVVALGDSIIGLHAQSD